ncbi:DUF4190 domain-containing protein [archaeon]|nr:DUF4190 domain-containing protein [archaeon]MBT6698451.1 DUF4190 domain-containing protein [archaeon]
MAKKSKGTNTLSILSLIFSFLFWPLGLIFGIVSLGQIKKSKEEGKGLAVAGIIISSSAFFITFLLFSSFFIAIGAVSESISDLTIEDIAQVTIDSETINDESEVNNEIEESIKTTIGEQNALKKAKSYLRSSSFSYNGLIDQLEFSGFTPEEAEYGVDNSGADWNEQAVSKAESYLRSSSFSYNGLIDQLEFSGFTPEEAEYGVDNSDADWYEQAALKAESYLRSSAFSRDGLINQLEFSGFTNEEAEYGVQAVGYE